MSACSGCGPVSGWALRPHFMCRAGLHARMHTISLGGKGVCGFLEDGSLQLHSHNCDLEINRHRWPSWDTLQKHVQCGVGPQIERFPCLMQTAQPAPLPAFERSLLPLLLPWAPHPTLFFPSSVSPLLLSTPLRGPSLAPSLCTRNLRSWSGIQVLQRSLPPA